MQTFNQGRPHALGKPYAVARIDGMVTSVRLENFFWTTLTRSRAARWHEQRAADRQALQ